jgi:hypothetical protein
MDGKQNTKVDLFISRQIEKLGLRESECRTPQNNQRWNLSSRSSKKIPKKEDTNKKIKPLTKTKDNEDAQSQGQNESPKKEAIHKAATNQPALGQDDPMVLLQCVLPEESKQFGVRGDQEERKNDFEASNEPRVAFPEKKEDQNKVEASIEPKEALGDEAMKALGAYGGPGEAWGKGQGNEANHEANKAQENVEALGKQTEAIGGEEANQAHRDPMENVSEAEETKRETNEKASQVTTSQMLIEKVGDIERLAQEMSNLLWISHEVGIKPRGKKIKTSKESDTLKPIIFQSSPKNN